MLKELNCSKLKYALWLVFVSVGGDIAAQPSEVDGKIEVDTSRASWSPWRGAAEVTWITAI